MQIACLGWGSLIWDPRNLKLSSDWNTDGPHLPIEFARESSDGRMTLVLVDDFKKSPSLWALLEAESIEIAKACLAEREGLREINTKYSIGYWVSNSGESYGKCSEEISSWASGKGLDGVVWTNLKYGFRSKRDEVPTISEVIKHLNGLQSPQRKVAEEYVRKAPAQVRTEFRSTLENEFGWEPINSNG
jgi:hypothetical protein